MTVPDAPSGHFAYLLFCESTPKDSSVCVKVGVSDQPLRRLSTIATHCPMTPRLLALCECGSRAVARALEAQLLKELSRWRSHGEWLVVPRAERGDFRALIGLQLKLQPGLRRREWTTINAEEYLKQQRQASGVVRSRYRRFAMRAGRAYRDFERDSRRA